MGLIDICQLYMDGTHLLSSLHDFPHSVAAAVNDLFYHPNVTESWSRYANGRIVLQ